MPVRPSLHQFVRQPAAPVSRRLVGSLLCVGLAGVALPLAGTGAALAAPATPAGPGVAARPATAVTTLVDTEHTGYNFALRSFTGFKAAGIITNNGAIDSNSTNLTVTTFNAAGAQLSQDNIFTQNEDILPGKIGLWTLTKSAPLAGFDHLTVTGIAGRTPTFSPVQNFATTAALGAPTSTGDRPVTGSVTNNDTRPSGGPELFEIYRDASGKMVDGDYTFGALPTGAQTLAPGATAPTSDYYDATAPQTATNVQTFADALTPLNEIPFIFPLVPTLAPAGSKIKVTAKLSPLSGSATTPLPGRTLLLQARTGTKGYVGIGQAVTDAKGVATFVTVLKSKTYYQVVFPGDASFYPGLSGEVSSNVSPTLSISRLSAQHRSHTFYVRGRAYGAEGDFVYLQRATGHGRYTTVAKTRVSYNGSFSFKQRFGKVSTYNYRVAVSTGLFHTSGTSRSLSVRIV